jgi:hypothetical protein
MEEFKIEDINLSSLLGIDAHWNINKALARSIGLEASILLADLISKEEYFRIKEELDEEGYFYNTQENIEIDTTLSPHKQRQAINLLIEKGLVKMKLAGSPARNYYKIDKVQLLKFLTSSSQNFSHQVIKIFNNSLYNKNKENKNKVIRKKNTKKKEELSPEEEVEARKLASEIKEIIHSFEEIDKTNSEYYGRKDMREACKFLIETYTFEKVILSIKEIPRLKASVPFFPSIVNPKELKFKWVKARDAIQRVGVEKIYRENKTQASKTFVNIF